jgi:hypothetical protein
MKPEPWSGPGRPDTPAARSSSSRKGPEGGVPEDAPADRALADRAGPVIQMLAGVAPEVGEGLLMGVEELGQGLIGVAPIETAPAEAQREDEDMQHSGPRAEQHGGGPPINLALLPGWGLEATQRPLGAQPRRPQRPHEELDRVVAAPVAALLPELLEQDLRGVAHQGRPLPQIVPVRGQHRVRPQGAVIGGPPDVPQTAPHRFAVQLQAPGDLGDRHPLLPQPANLVPALLTDHRYLLRWGDRWPDGPGLDLDLDRHFVPSRQWRGGDFSVPMDGDY